METSLNVVAIIPARGGSKRVPGKNLLPLAGAPLLVHSIRHAKQSAYVSATYVSTDDASIAAVAEAHAAEVVIRPVELSGDKATSESALVHVLDYRVKAGLNDPDLVVFLQCTSPVRSPRDVDNAIETLLETGADSLFSACENNRLVWAMKDEQPCSITYDYHRRQREQDMPKQYRENGSIYVFRPEILREYNNRLGGKIAVYEMDYWSSFQLDTEEHAQLLEWVLRHHGHAFTSKRLEDLELVVFDFDGVMTDNTVMVSETGLEAVRCHRGDGWGIAHLLKAGIRTMVLSTEKNPVVAARCAKLNLPCHQGIANKASYLADLLKHDNIDPERVAYVGNDLNDMECMSQVGVPVAVADAHPSVIAVSVLVLSRCGGQGAVREFCDMVLARIAKIPGHAESKLVELITKDLK